jgi:hypothetical protein
MSVIGKFGIGAGDGVAGSEGICSGGMSLSPSAGGTGGPFSRLP